MTVAACSDDGSSDADPLVDSEPAPTEPAPTEPADEEQPVESIEEEPADE